MSQEEQDMAILVHSFPLMIDALAKTNFAFYAQEWNSSDGSSHKRIALPVEVTYQKNGHTMNKRGAFFTLLTKSIFAIIDA